MCCWITSDNFLGSASRIHILPEEKWIVPWLIWVWQKHKAGHLISSLCDWPYTRMSAPHRTCSDTDGRIWRDFGRGKRVKTCLVRVALRQQNKGNSVPLTTRKPENTPLALQPRLTKKCNKHRPEKLSFWLPRQSLSKRRERKKRFYYETPSNGVPLTVGFFLLVHSLFKCTFILSNLIKNIWDGGQSMFGTYVEVSEGLWRDV